MSETRRLLFVFLAVVAGVASYAQWKKVPLRGPASPNPQLYPANADAKKEIAQALSSAAKSSPAKRVVLVFGANWCYDCHVLENAFHQPRIAPLLNRNFKVVHVDIGEYNKNLDLAKKYQVDPQQGVPSMAVLEANGTVVFSTHEYSKARVLSEEDVIAFLEKWKPQPRTANKS